ncbi:ABC transporter permease [Nocardioides mangrovicus]|uniref:ABC transporter permease n=1 Tax=Nocardioides mangrovicus TaxID=2478913 RepID=A0A3L8P5B6_9ACTN|nr:ABC transporter permease [Nocardioides mangrovicus]
MEVLVGGAIVVVIVVAGFAAPLIAPYRPDAIDFARLLSPPSGAHLFGTDDSGRDVFSRTLYGLRVDLVVVLLVTYIPLPIGVVVGAVAGHVGGVVDAVVSRLTDIMISFPFIVLVIATVAIVGPGLTGVAIGIPLVSWALYARLARSQMLLLREQQFMLAATTLGFRRSRVIFRHGVPNLLRTCLVYSTVDIVLNLLVLAGLSYLGLGQQPPGAELGTIIAGGESNLLDAWWIATLPGLVLVLFGIGMGLLGDGLSDDETRSNP